MPRQLNLVGRAVHLNPANPSVNRPIDRETALPSRVVFPFPAKSSWWKGWYRRIWWYQHTNFNAVVYAGGNCRPAAILHIRAQALNSSLLPAVIQIHFPGNLGTFSQALRSISFKFYYSESVSWVAKTYIIHRQLRLYSILRQRLIFSIYHKNAGCCHWVQPSHTQAVYLLTFILTDAPGFFQFSNLKNKRLSFRP